jgi:hypothetical protein
MTLFERCLDQCLGHMPMSKTRAQDKTSALTFTCTAFLPALPKPAAAALIIINLYTYSAILLQFDLVATVAAADEGP